MRELKISQQYLVDYLTSNNITTSIDVIKSWFRKNDDTRSILELGKIILISKMLNLSVDEVV